MRRQSKLDISTSHHITFEPLATAGGFLLRLARAHPNDIFQL
ncbi:hypothetical protein CSC12_0151 [Klebsiella michiganensis]|nr:hypothetical protein CSC12_0151 [Klebsiella michiganensis]